MRIFLTLAVVFGTGDGLADETWLPFRSDTSGGTFYDVWMADGSTGWTVRSGGDILRTEDGGTTWIPQVSGAVRTLLGVGGVSPSKVVAVGRGGSLQVWDGVEWTGQSSGTEENLNAVIGIAEDDFWACGDRGTMLHWDGVGWSQSPTPVESDLQALWASGPDDIWAVGGNEVIRWDGNAWSQMAYPGTVAESVWGDAGGNVWVGGSRLFRWDGSVWDAGQDLSTEIKGIWGSSANDVWFVGNRRDTFFHFDGSSVSLVALGGPSNFGLFDAITGTGADHLIAVGGDSMVRKWDGNTWDLVHQFSSTFLRGGFWVSGSSEIVGADGRSIVRLDGDQWVQEAGVLPGDAGAIWGADAQSIWVVGSGGMIWKWDGVAWAAQSSGVDRGLIGVHGSASDDVWAIGGSHFLHWNGNTWTDVPNPDLFQARAIFATGPGQAIACGADGLIIEWDGDEWQEIEGLTDQSLTAIWGTGAGKLWIVGAGGCILHRTSGSWSIEDSGTTSDLAGVSGDGDGGVVAVGSNGTIVRRVGGTWRQEPSGAWFNLAQVAAAGDGRFIAGSGSPLRISPAAGSVLRSSQMQVELDGVGVILSSDQQHHLGAVEVGTSAMRKVKVRNLGSSSLAMGSHRLASGEFIELRIDLAPEGALHPASGFIDPGGSATYEITARPSEAGTRTDTVEFLSNDPASPQFDIDVLVSGFTPRQLETWTEVPIGGFDQARDLWTDGEPFGVAVGGGIARWDGSAWQIDHASDLGDPALWAVWGSDPEHVWAVGEDGTILFFDGNSWAEQPSGTTEILRDVWGVDPSNVLAVGEAGTLLQWDGTSWAGIDLGTEEILSSISGSGASDIWIGGNYHYDGTSWELVPGAISASDVWVSSAGEVWAISSTRLYRREGNLWVEDAELGGARVRSIWGRDSQTLWAGGQRGLVWRWDGERWRSQPSGNTFSLKSITGNGADQVFAIGGGTVFQATTTAAFSEQWRLQNFGTTTDAGDAADEADPDFDGLKNSEERALGLDPRVADSADLEIDGGALVRRGGPVVGTGQDPEGGAASMQLLYPQLRNHIGEQILYSPEFSADLRDWNPHAGRVEVIAVDADFEVMAITFPDGILRNYFRLTVESDQ